MPSDWAYEKVRTASGELQGVAMFTGASGFPTKEAPFDPRSHSRPEYSFARKCQPFLCYSLVRFLTPNPKRLFEWGSLSAESIRGERFSCPSQHLTTRHY